MKNDPLAIVFCLTAWFGWALTGHATPPTSRPTQKQKKPKPSSMEHQMLNVWSKKRKRRLRPKQAPAAKLRQKKPSSKLFRSQGMSKSDIARVIRRRWNVFRRCYDVAMQKSPKAWDTLIVVRWIINAKGRVSAAAVVKTTGRSEALAQCLVREIKKLKFPKPHSCGVVVVNYPFRVCLAH
ncbi:MAG: hypothetical protein EP343_08815 [Deltaproteobacteria bacterium]|nr:MAG: hypothetical protein EP343_08815 [Deltaproteobacteria bacterium]